MIVFMNIQLQFIIYYDIFFSSYSLKIFYSTTPKCTALQWLPAEQTLGKKHAYLFSQCQAIHARSLVPCQDTPGVKMTYSAKVSQR